MLRLAFSRAGKGLVLTAQFVDPSKDQILARIEGKGMDTWSTKCAQLHHERRDGKERQERKPGVE